jgi:alpha-3'-ketoglucosidase
MNRSRLLCLVAVVVLVWIFRPMPVRGEEADNTLSAAEKKDGWVLLFDGKTPEGWQTSDGKPGKTPVENGCLNPHGSGGYMLIYQKTWADFVLSLDFKISKNCNSGVFIRTYPLTPRPGKDVGFNGIEVAIDDTTTAGFHDTGAIYDLVKPSTNRMKPAGQWNHMMITCNGPNLAIELNGKLVNEMDLDQWTLPNRRPDGSEHKFDVAYKNHPRFGYIGLQDHGSPCWYKNIKIKNLKTSNRENE